VKITGLGLINKIWSWGTDNPVKAIIITSVFVRLIIAALYQHITLYPDSDDYILLAERFLDLDLAGYEGQRSPGYPLLILLTGFSDVSLVILQSLAGICTLILTYKILLLSGIKEKISLIVTLVLSCYLPAVFFELAILTETVTLLVISFIFYLFLKLIKSKEYNMSSFLILSLLCGYMVLIKPFYILLPVLLVIILLWQSNTMKNIRGRYAMFLFIPLFVFLGWSYVNKVNTGYFVSSTFYGINLAQNCVSFAEKTTPEYKEIGDIYAKYRDNRVSDKEQAMVIWEAYPELEEKTGLAFPDLSKRLYDYSIATIKENPGAYLKQVFVSWRDFWKTSLYWEPYSFGVDNVAQVVLYVCYAERILLQLIKILFVLLIPLNFVYAIRRKDISPAFAISVIVLIASVLQAFMTYGTNSRYSFPFEMLMVISVVLNIKQYLAYRKTENRIKT